MFLTRNPGIFSLYRITVGDWKKQPQHTQAIEQTQDMEDLSENKILTHKLEDIGGGNVY